MNVGKERRRPGQNLIPHPVDGILENEIEGVKFGNTPWEEMPIILCHLSLETERLNCMVC